MPTTKKRIILVLLTFILSLSGTVVTYAESNTDALRSTRQVLEQQQKVVQQKQLEKQAVTKDIQGIQKELESLYTDITKNKDAMAATQLKIDQTNQLIEKKKEEIVVLEDKILGRKDIMKKRAVSLQQNDNLSLVINLFFESDSISEFIQRASAVSALMDADKEILTAQKTDLLQIENDKKEIDKQEQVLLGDQQILAEQQAMLDQNLQKRQQTLAAMQAKYNQLSQQVALAEQEKAGVESKMRDIQAKINLEQAAAKARETASSSASSDNGSNAGVAIEGTEMYVTATAYSVDTSGAYTALGYNIRKNPNMKMIAVDPRVIPLGSKVWVEGYGVAIAGDTGSAIKGHIIDVLFATNSQALHWGRKTVKIVVLN